MPDGKPVGVRCLQLTEDNRCSIFGQHELPAVRAKLHEEPPMCGAHRAHALTWLAQLEQATCTA
jgi:hypothetical protein